MQIINHNQIGYTICYEIEECVLNFWIYKNVELGVGEDKKTMWEQEDCSFTDETTKVQVAIEGAVKWDGCTNFTFPECIRGNYMHACNQEQLMNIGFVLACVWEIAKNEMPNFLKK